MTMIMTRYAYIFSKWQYIHVHSTHGEFSSHFCPCFQEQVEERLGYPLEAVRISKFGMPPKCGWGVSYTSPPKKPWNDGFFSSSFLLMDIGGHSSSQHWYRRPSCLERSNQEKTSPVKMFVFGKFLHPLKDSRVWLGKKRDSTFGLVINTHAITLKTHIKWHDAQPPTTASPPKKVRRRWTKKCCLEQCWYKEFSLWL